MHEVDAARIRQSSRRKRTLRGIAFGILLAAMATGLIASRRSQPTATETAMALNLELALDRSDYISGESILANISLSNTGSSDVEIPSLAMNDAVLSLSVLDGEGVKLGSYNWIDVQQRLQKPKIKSDRVMLDTLAAGSSDTLSRDLMYLREPLREGKYSVVAHYTWEDHDLESQPVVFEVAAARGRQLALGWDHDFGGPYHLIMAWVDGGEENPILMESASFGSDHKLLHHTTRHEFAGGVAEQLAVSRDVGTVAAHEATIVWTAGTRLFWLGVGPNASGAPALTDLGEAGWKLVDSVYRDGPNTNVLVANGANVRALELHADGSIVTRGEHSKAAKQRSFVFDHDSGAYYAYAIETADGHELRVVRWNNGSASDDLIWSSRHPIVALSSTILDDRSPALAVLVRQKSDDDDLSCVIFQGENFSEHVDAPGLEFSAKTPFDFSLGSDGSAHVLLRAVGGQPNYIGGDGGSPVSMPSIEALDDHARLLVGRSGRAFAVAPDADAGIILAPLVAAPAAGVRTNRRTGSGSL